MEDQAELRRSIVRVYLKGDDVPDGREGPFSWKFIPRQGEILRLPPPDGEKAWPAFVVERVEWWQTHAIGRESDLNADVFLKREI